MDKIFIEMHNSLCAFIQKQVNIATQQQIIVILTELEEQKTAIQNLQKQIKEYEAKKSSYAVRQSQFSKELLSFRKRHKYSQASKRLVFPMAHGWKQIRNL